MTYRRTLSALALFLLVAGSLASMSGAAKLSGDRVMDSTSLQSLLEELQNVPESDVTARHRMGEKLFCFTEDYLRIYPKDIDALTTRASMTMELNRALDGILISEELKELKNTSEGEDKEKILKVLGDMNLKGWLSSEFFAAHQQSLKTLIAARKAMIAKAWDRADECAQALLKADPQLPEALDITKAVKTGTGAEKEKWIGIWTGTFQKKEGQKIDRTITIEIQAGKGTEDPSVVYASDSYAGERQQSGFYSKSKINWSAPGTLAASGVRKVDWDKADCYELPEVSLGKINNPISSFSASGKQLSLTLEANGQKVPPIHLTIGDDGKIHNTDNATEIFGIFTQMVSLQDQSRIPGLFQILINVRTNNPIPVLEKK